MVDAAGTNSYAYTVGGQLWTEDGPFDNDTVTNSYVNGLRTALALQQPSAVWTNGFIYDLAGRLTNGTSQAGSHGYLLGATAAGSPLVKRLTLPNTSYITNTLDCVARLTSTYLRKNDDTVLNKHEYTYNTGGQRVQQIRVDNSYTDYFYDGIGQLTNADCSVASEDRAYFYDSAWNLNRRTNNGVTQVFQVDNKNQLTNAIAQAMTFDDNGNMVTASNGCNVLVYDDENRLTQWFFYQNGSSQPAGGDKRTDFVYDGKSRLRKRIEYTWFLTQSTNPPPEDRPSMEMQEPADATNWTAQLEIRYLYDGNRVIQERNGANTPVVSYTRGTDLSGTLEDAGGIGGLLARSAGYSGGAWSDHVFYHADGNGNISRLVNISQGSAAYCRYDPFGNIIGKSGTHANANVYWHSSKELHTNSGLYYYLYRFYNPNLQRWINRDPIAERGGLNLYAFGGGDPVTQVDTDGKALLPWLLNKLGRKQLEITVAGPTFGPCVFLGEAEIVGGPYMGADRMCFWKCVGQRNTDEYGKVVYLQTLSPPCGPCAPPGPTLSDGPVAEVVRKLPPIYDFPNPYE